MPKQKEIVEHIKGKLDADEQLLLYVDAPGGGGKTFVFNTIAHYVRGQSWVIKMVASTGIASLLLVDGYTVHTMFKVPIPINHDSTLPISGQSALAQSFRDCKAIIWDEVSMSHRYVFEAVDRMLQDVRQRPGEEKKPFGGLTIILGGGASPTCPVASRSKSPVCCPRPAYRLRREPYLLCACPSHCRLSPDTTGGPRR